MRRDLNKCQGCVPADDNVSRWGKSIQDHLYYQKEADLTH